MSYFLKTAERKPLLTGPCPKRERGAIEIFPNAPSKAYFANLMIFVAKIYISSHQQQRIAVYTI